MADAKFNTFEAQCVAFLFNNTTCATFPTTTAQALSLQLHTASPGETGDSGTSEANYTGYARVAVERTSSGWTVSGTSANLTATVSFPQCGGGSNTITHFSVGGSTVAGTTTASLYYGTVTPNITVTNGVTPRLTTNTAISEL